MMMIWVWSHNEGGVQVRAVCQLTVSGGGEWVGGVREFAGGRGERCFGEYCLYLIGMALSRPAIL